MEEQNMAEMLPVKVKEEPLSDDENEEVDALADTNYLENSIGNLLERESENCTDFSSYIKTENIRLDEEHGDETNHFISNIKSENTNYFVEDESLKVEEVTAWADDQYESSCSSENPDFRDEMCSDPEFKHFLDENEIKDDVQNSRKRKIEETLPNSYLYEERTVDIASDEDSIEKLKMKKNVPLNLDVLESELKMIKPVTVRLTDCLKTSELPAGWRIQIVVRKNDKASNGKRKDVYYYSPNGKQLRSKIEVEDYCRAHGLLEDLKIFKKYFLEKRNTSMYSKYWKSLKSPSENQLEKLLDKQCMDKFREKYNGKFAKSCEVLADDQNTTVKQVSKRKSRKWSDEMKLFAVKKYLETRNYKETIEAFVTAFNVTIKPPSKCLVLKWVVNIKHPRDDTIRQNSDLRVNHPLKLLPDHGAGIRHHLHIQGGKWTAEMKAYAVEKYKETRNMKITMADFTEKFKPTKPIYPSLIEYWVSKSQYLGTLEDLRFYNNKERPATTNLEALLEDKIRATDYEATSEAIEEQIAHESYLQWLRDNEQRAKAQEVNSWNIEEPKSSLRNIRIDKEHDYYGRKKLRIVPKGSAKPCKKNDQNKSKSNVLDDLGAKDFEVPVTGEQIEDEKSKEASAWDEKRESTRKIKWYKKRGPTRPTRKMNWSKLDCNEVPKGDSVLSVMKNVFNDKDDVDDSEDDNSVDNCEDDNEDNNSHQFSKYAATIGKYLKMWETLYPLTHVQEQKNIFQETKGSVIETMNQLKKMELERKIKLQNVINVPKNIHPSAKKNKEIKKEKEATTPNDGASTEIILVEYDQNVIKRRVFDRQYKIADRQDARNIENFVQTWTPIYESLTEEEIRNIYKASESCNQAISFLKYLSKERQLKLAEQIKEGQLYKQLEESNQDIEIDESNNKGTFEEDKLFNKYLKMWKVLYPSVGVQDQRRVYQENNGNVKKTMVKLKELNEDRETKRIRKKEKDPFYTVWSLVDEETFREGVCCPFCGRYFVYKEPFLRHYNTHREEKPYFCEYCEYRSKTKDNVKIHRQRNHLEGNLFFKNGNTKPWLLVCPTCSYHCKSQAALKAHIRRTHQKAEEALDVHIGKTPPKVYNYQDGQERPFACAYCPYRSNQKGNLKTHLIRKHQMHPDNPMTLEIKAKK